MKNKNLLLIIALFFSSLMMSGQVPQRIDFQAMARDGSGNPLMNQDISVRLSVMEGSSTVYSEVHAVTTDDYGLFTLAIGEGTPISGDFTAIDWSTGNQKVKVEIDPNGGSSFVYMGTSNLASVPYALYSPGGGGVWSQNGDDIYYNDGNVGIGTDSPEGVLHVPCNNNDVTAVFGTNISNPVSWPVVVIGGDGSGMGATLYIGENSTEMAHMDWYNSSFNIGTSDGDSPLRLQNYGGNVGVGDDVGDPLVELHVSESYSDGVQASDLGLNVASPIATAIFGRSVNNNTDVILSAGVTGLGSSDNSTWSMGVYGEANSSENVNFGIYGAAMGSGDVNAGVAGYAIGDAASNYAGYFYGDVHITGTLSKAGGSFKIDHPQDPANKYLIHSFVESPDMMNIYNGNVVTDEQGLAVVQLPDYFEIENVDYRYQLTVIGEFAQAIVKEKIANNQFVIMTDKPNVEVSWMVTGIRNDAWANAHRIVPEVEKKGIEKGHYLNPELFGQPMEMGIMFPAMLDLNRKQNTNKPATKTHGRLDRNFNTNK
jgi:hypothetical protein